MTNEYRIELLMKNARYNIKSKGLDQDEEEQALAEYEAYLSEKSELEIRNLIMINF